LSAPEIDFLEVSRAYRALVLDALLRAGKRYTVAEKVGVSEGELSKIVNGELEACLRLLAVLDLEVRPKGYVQALERLLKEKL
jgi:hypothetical protein